MKTSLTLTVVLSSLAGMMVGGCSAQRTVYRNSASDAVTVQVQSTVSVPVNAVQRVVTPVRVTRERVRDRLTHAQVVNAGRGYVVISQETTDDAGFTTGRPRFELAAVSGDSDQITVKSVIPGNLPASIRRITTNQVSMFDGNRWVCDAEFTDRVVMSWDGPHDGENRASADTVWDEGTHAYVAHYRTLRGDCSNAKWARDLALPTPVFAVEGSVTPEIHQYAIGLLRGASDYGGFQESWKTGKDSGDITDSAFWWDEGKIVERLVRVFRTPEGREWVYTYASASEGCGGFNAFMGLMVEMQRSGSQITEVQRVVVHSNFIPTHFADLDQDGEPDVISEGMITRSESATMESADYVPAQHGCNC